MLTTRYVLLVAVAVSLLCSSGFADDVTVKVISPDARPPATQPAEARRPDLSAPGSAVLVTTDRCVEQSLLKMRLTGDELARVKAAAGPFVDALADLDKPIKELRSQSRERFRAVQGSLDDPELLALNDKMYLLVREREQRMGRDRGKLVAAIVEALGEARGKIFKDGVDEHDPSTLAYARRMASYALPGFVAGAQLSDAQKAKVLDVLCAGQAEEQKRLVVWQEKEAELIRQLAAKPNDPELLKSRAAHREKQRDMWRMQALASRKAVEQVLSPEQLAQVSEHRRKYVDGAANASIIQVTVALRNAKLTDEQARKVAELTSAAREAMGKIDVFDPYSREELGKQLRRDIRALLTDEQKATLKNVPHWGGFAP